MSISSSEELTVSENKYIDEYYNNLSESNLFYIVDDILAPLYIHKLLPNLYEVTNKIKKILLNKNDLGIRYSSVYFPTEFSGYSKIATVNGIHLGNYVLTQGELERYNVFHVFMIIRHDQNGKKYLYDLIKIKKETGNPLGC